MTLPSITLQLFVTLLTVFLSPYLFFKSGLTLPTVSGHVGGQFVGGSQQHHKTSPSPSKGNDHDHFPISHIADEPN